MPVLIDNQLKEQIPYDPASYPISFYQHELETLAQWSGPFHWHPGFEIATAETGMLDYQVGDKHVILHAGDSIFVNGNVLHSIRQISGNTPDPMPNVVFSGSLIAPEGSLIYEKYISPLQQCDDLPFILFSADNQSLQAVNDFIQNIYHCFRNPAPCSEMIIQRNVSHIFEYIYSNINCFPRYKSNRIQLTSQIRLQKMLDFIYSHYQEHITLENIADAGNVSRSEAGRCFKTFMNSSPIEVLIQHRLQIANKMLSEKIYTIKEISDLCGFNSVNYFRKQFKAEYGITPGKALYLGK
ncbi:MAG: AraC family transcriptional regulator [Lentisphaeria bacterium]|nr:AraC family transcriptional regulator [Lentisphaeria bacterium]